MPEGPEIKRAADRLAECIAGQRAHLVEFAFPQLFRHARRLTGKIVRSVEPRGKAMLTHFESGDTIYSHNQLYGEWQILTRGQAPDPARQIRVAIHTAQHVAVLYSASEIEVWKTRDLYRHPYLRKLGVEVLAPNTRIEDIHAHVNLPQFARKRLAGLLLDQSFVAGLGNYLRSEILFVARIGPEARIADISSAQLHALAQAAFELTHQSYRTSGVTNNPTIAKGLKAAGLPFARYRHWVFDRAGELCYACGTSIERLDISGRGLYWCRQCQEH